LKWRTEKRTDDNGEKRSVPVYYKHHRSDDNIGGFATKNAVAAKFGVRAPKSGGHHKQVWAQDTTAPQDFNGHYVTIESPWAEGSPVQRHRSGNLPWRDRDDKRAFSGWVSSTTRHFSGMANDDTGVIHLNVLYEQFKINMRYNRALHSDDIHDFIWQLLHTKEEGDKTRFEFACMPDGSVWGLRAHQGHATSDPDLAEMSLTPITALDVSFIYHATYLGNVESIKEKGLYCGGVQAGGRSQICFSIASANDQRYRGGKTEEKRTMGGDPFVMSPRIVGTHYGEADLGSPSGLRSSAMESVCNDGFHVVHVSSVIDERHVECRNGSQRHLCQSRVAGRLSLMCSETPYSAVRHACELKAAFVMLFLGVEELP